jgi:four helix bundle protein
LPVLEIPQEFERRGSCSRARHGLYHHVSMPSNVAEGFSRHSTALYIQHLWTAHASGAELETQLEIGRRVHIVTEADCDRLIADAQEAGRMINGLVRSLERAHQ